MKRGNAISIKEWLYIALVAIIGFLWLYAISHNLLAAVILGIPTSMGGAVVGLLLLKKISPNLFVGETNNGKITTSVVLGGIVVMLVATTFLFVVFPSTTSRFAIGAVDMLTIAHFVHNRLRNERDEHESRDDGPAA